MNSTEQFLHTPLAAPLTDTPQADIAQTDMRADIAEPPPSTQEISVAHVKLYAQSTPHPTGAAAAEQPPQIPLAPIKRVRAQFNPLADGMLYLVVFLGGCLGTAMRYGMTQLFPRPLASQGALSAFHTATFCSNMIACLIFAAFTEYVSQASWIRKRTRQLTSRGVGMGMCGGFSTLSAMVIEELSAIREGQIAGFICYTLASFVCGLFAAALGVRLASALALRHMSRHMSHHASDQMSRRISEHAPYQGSYRVSQVIDAIQSAKRMSARSTATNVADVAVLPAFEPAPVTDEIPLVGDLSAGEAVEVQVQGDKDAETSNKEVDLRDLPSQVQEEMLL